MDNQTIGLIVFAWLHDVHATSTGTRTHKQRKKTIDDHLLPKLGNLIAADATPKQLLDAINLIPTYNIRKRMLQVLINAYDYACVCGNLQYNPASALTKYIKKSDYKAGAYAVLPKHKWPRFFADCERTQHRDVTKVYFWTLAYTALRRSEAAGALKAEFDFNRDVWIVPAARMKNGKDHTVYLAPSLKLMLTIFFGSNDSQWAFPSPHNQGIKHIDPWSGLYIIKKAGYATEQTLHGLRKIFSSHAHESGLFSSDSIELSIDHAIHGVRGVYNLAKYDAERAQLAKWYGRELDMWRGL